MSNKDDELNFMLRNQQINQLSSQEQQGREQITSKSQYRKPIKDPFSDQSQDSDSDLQNNTATLGNPFPPKPPMQKTMLQQLQSQMKWDKNQQIEVDILAKLQGQGMKDKKIRQLASKYKSLNIAYERQRTQRKNLENQLNQQIKTSEELNKSTVSQQRTQRKSLQKSQIKSISQKCNNCSENQKKVCEFRLKSQNMKSELNKVMRLLARQLGEGFDVDKALSQENSWKGRQQKIQKLKGRVRQLQNKLQNNGVNVSHMSGFTQITTNNNNNKTMAGFQSTRTSAMMAENKRKQLDNLKVQVQALKNENQLLHGKVKSLTSRKLILENEMKELKSQFEKKRQIFIEKSDNDDKFISLLKNENQKLKKDERVVTKVIYKDDSNTDVVTLKKQNQVLKKKLKTLMNGINQRQNKQQNGLQKQPHQKQVKDLNSRVLSAEKRKNLQEQYIKSNKYLKKMSNEDQEQIYKNWKNSLNKNS